MSARLITHFSPFRKAWKILSTCSGCWPQMLLLIRLEMVILGDFPNKDLVLSELRTEENLLRREHWIEAD